MDVQIHLCWSGRSNNVQNRFECELLRVIRMSVSVDNDAVANHLDLESVDSSPRALGDLSFDCLRQVSGTSVIFFFWRHDVLLMPQSLCSDSVQVLALSHRAELRRTAQ
jgi:hypothetical protein